MSTDQDPQIDETVLQPSSRPEGDDTQEVESLIGKTLHHYRIIEKLGEGGMGEVYAAEDTKLNRRVAIKVLATTITDDDGERLKRFHREAQAVAALNHPNIVTIFSVEELDDLRFLTMEEVDGQTLDRLIPKGGMKLSAFFDLAIPMIEALSAAHEKGITHRDLKPGNVMVTAEGRVKILDFGLAKLQGGGDRGDGFSTTTQALTQEGSILGTVAFMSPEQLQGKSPDSRSDIFSLGIVLYQMATGERPFAGESPADLISCILRDDPPPVSELKVSLPHHLGRILKKCLEKDPDRRYQNVSSVANDLRELKAELDSGTLRTTATRVPASASKGAPWRWIGLAVLLIGAGIAAWGLLGKHTPLPEPTEEAAPVAIEETTIEIGAVDNLGPEEAEPFVIGLSDEVIAKLSEMDGLGVLLGEGAIDPAAEAEAPAADYELSGSVQWGEGDDDGRRLRMAFDLTRKADGLLVWSERYDRQSSDLFETQTEIATLLSRKVALSVLDYEVADLDLELGDFEPPKAADAEPESPPRPTREAPPKPPEPVAGEGEEGTGAVVAPVTKRVETPLVGDVELRIVMITFLPRGVLTVFEDDVKILQENFRFRSKEDPPYSVETAVEVDVQTERLRIYVAPKGKPAAAMNLEPEFSRLGRTTLRLELRDSGTLTGELDPLD